MVPLMLIVKVPFAVTAKALLAERAKMAAAAIREPLRKAFIFLLKCEIFELGNTDVPTKHRECTLSTNSVILLRNFQACQEIGGNFLEVLVLKVPKKGKYSLKIE